MLAGLKRGARGETILREDKDGVQWHKKLKLPFTYVSLGLISHFTSFLLTWPLCHYTCVLFFSGELHCYLLFLNVPSFMITSLKVQNCKCVIYGQIKCSNNGFLKCQ